MNTRFTNARLLMPDKGHSFKIINGEIWTKGDTIVFSGTEKQAADHLKNSDVIVWDEIIDCEGNLIMPGFKNAHTHTAMTFP